MKQTRASILVGLLWVIALLSVVVISVLHTASMDLRVGKNYGDSIQAYYLAVAGAEKAKALLYLDADQRRKTRQNHTAGLYNSPSDFRDVALGRGQFRVFRQGSRSEGGQVVYGVSDEESRLNVNHASAEDLGRLDNMPTEVAAAIVDFRDEDSNTSPNGAEQDYYASLQPPYIPRDGPLRTLKELLLVRGMNRNQFLGEDVNLNGALDPEEDDGDASYPRDNGDGHLDTGWAALFTLNSQARNVNAAGESRINAQTADENTLTQVQGITTDIARAIVAYRGQTRLESVVDLLNVTAMRPQNQGPPNNRQGGQPGQPQPAPQMQPSGPPLISEDLLRDVADYFTTAEEQEQPGSVNVNTASIEVLRCLPGITRELADAIVSHRQSSGYFQNIAGLLRVPGMTRDIVKGLGSRVDVRSETFRILSEGKVNSTGARKRIEVIVRVGPSSVDTLSYREDL